MHYRNIEVAKYLITVQMTLGCFVWENYQMIENNMIPTLHVNGKQLASKHLQIL